eukprot:3443607-Alexandrium_andersonii.AAC.1
MGLVRVAGGEVSRTCVNGMSGNSPCVVRRTGSSRRRRSIGACASAVPRKRIIGAKASSSGSNAST